MSYDLQLWHVEWTGEIGSIAARDVEQIGRGLWPKSFRCGGAGAVWSAVDDSWTVRRDSDIEAKVTARLISVDLASVNPAERLIELPIPTRAWR